MSQKKAEFLLKWENPAGEDLALLEVCDEELDESVSDYRWLEIVKKKDDRWDTVDQLSYVEEIIDFGIPEDLRD